MELNEALTQISEIRQQMARSEVFRGYRSMTVGFSGILGIVGAIVQSQWLPSPTTKLETYLCLWLVVAAVSLLISGLELFWRATVNGAGLLRQMTVIAVRQFTPCLVVGGLLTLCIYRGAPQVAWMLPGLWALLFSMGIFSSYRFLPRPVFWVGAYYVVCGCLCLMWAQGEHALSPWTMALTFGGGQIVGAVILFWTLERPNASKAVRQN